MKKLLLSCSLLILLQASGQQKNEKMETTASAPSLFFSVGGSTVAQDIKATGAHHRSGLYIEEAGIKTGINAFGYCVTGDMKRAQSQSSNNKFQLKPL